MPELLGGPGIDKRNIPRRPLRLHAHRRMSLRVLRCLRAPEHGCHAKCSERKPHQSVQVHTTIFSVEAVPGKSRLSTTRQWDRNRPPIYAEFRVQCGEGRSTIDKRLLTRIMRNWMVRSSAAA